jgi:catechol 2,3-dioxygenase-like lactoylglutathione lyase family enzyme
MYKEEALMLSKGRVLATIAVSDIAAGKAFYGDKLGLTQVDESPGGVTYEAAEGSRIFVYQSSFAGTNQATCATWTVADVEAVVNNLKSKGITFEQYDNLGPNMRREGDIHYFGDTEKAAWFKDPDGNILNVGSM